MIKRLWRWFKSFWQRLFGRKEAVSRKKPDDKVKTRELPTDAEYESLFLQLLDGVNDENWSRGTVKGFLASKNIIEGDLIGWLRRFGKNLLATNGKNRELAERMVRLSKVGCGELSQVAGEIGRQLLDKGEGEEKTKAEVWFDRGVEQFEAGDFQDSLESFDKTIGIKPDLHQAWFNRGVALDKCLQFEEAIASYDKAVEIKPDCYEAWCNRGITLVELLRFEQAIASYDKAVEIKPDYYEAWFNQ
ncbi:MAG: tetratricopeptide repeat protein [Rivularia sp. (in: cyanobacteria)]